ncbi:ead/Ea22-like family protein [Klebsiella pneumoniae]|uniref:ead/Ea22-like family protein n=1 Tax=Klebsiella pneumoniae TaxID=573 RepID=UPI0034D3DB5D
MTDITELALIKGQRVEAPYYLAECTECGKMYSSSKLIVSRNYFDGDADCYCPHCNADDADIADLGSGEQPAVMAWNYQQARIDTLVEALEKAQRYIEELREWNAGLAQESCERQQLISELEPISAAAEKLVRCKGRYHSEQNYRSLAALFGVTTPDLPPLEHENVHYADAAEMEIAALRQRIAELESRAVKLPDLRQIVSGDRYVWSDGVYNYSQDVKVALAAAGIKVEQLS